jgi:hypothetical protein
LAPITIVVVEFFRNNFNLKIFLKSGLLLIVKSALLYFAFRYTIDISRGDIESDGVMKAYLLSFDRSGKTFWDYVSMTYTHWTWAQGSYGWRQLTDFSLPTPFLYYQYIINLILGASLLLIPLAIIGKIKIPLSIFLFAGVILSAIALPIMLAVYLYFADFPYFFQPRYYTAYNILAVAFAVVFLNDMIRVLYKAFKHN